MWAKLLTKVILSLVTSLATKVYQVVADYFKRKKRVTESQEAAKKVEDAKSPSDVRDSVDDLP